MSIMDTEVTPDERAKQLSPRLRETLDCLLSGSSEKSIAEQLTLSPHTVHGYVKLIYRHFKVKSRAQLLAQWVRLAKVLSLIWAFAGDSVMAL
jgi:DNA-binding NarL/FixJ family response regulator